MPTLAGDVQAVLADGKVLFQGQEVAFVVAEDRYVAADAVELVEVEYEPLPALVDPLAALAGDAPVLREDIADKTEGAHGARRHPNHIFTWEAGDAEAAGRAIDEAEWWRRSRSPTSASIRARSRPAAASRPWTR